MDSYDKTNRKLPGLLLLLFISVIAALNLFAPDRTFSESENRMLEQLPHFSWKTLMAGTFTSDFEKYVSDQFVLRDLWIEAKSETDRIMGKKESNGVYLGKDGFMLKKFTPPSDEDLKEKIAAIHAFCDATPDLTKYMMLVPTAQSVLTDKLPSYASDNGELAYREKVQRSLRENLQIVDVYPALAGKREQSLFYKTDHHWTTTGAYEAYQVLGREMGFEPKVKDDFRIEKVTDTFYGSLYSKSGYRHVKPDSIEFFLPKDNGRSSVEYVDEQQSTDSLYAMENLRKKDKYAVFLNGNHGLIKITTGNREGRKLLVVKDSYANSFLPFLAEHFQEMYVVDLRYYEGNLQKLILEQHLNEMLLLYNVQTFFEDPSIQTLADQAE
ncbi:DHHW family protein [Brevibacillus ruminantium]|uniref:DHHW family protein n=1 Tax=Brevibacillus ruminantium TaxID=2950604 RepID=A0ABY4WL68_9BACL|nr:DHHW family protein [Brevibacillus ruminantium]USG67896.1 DHHW family protein [Brevibacillus ruminantium]